MSKLVSLEQAVRSTVEPGATLVFALTHNRSHAAAFEVARQFRDRRCLNLVATGLLEYATILSAAGAIARTESAFAGNTYPAPSPSRQLVGEIDDSQDSDPDWTNLTMTLRLMAGAMGWPFVPVTSLAGSGLWGGENRAELRDPFSGETTRVIAALCPDVAFVHVPIADTLGNAVIHAPDAEEAWAVWAFSKVVVTADRVVAPEVLRRLGPRHGIPGAIVDCVVEAPFGAHPQGLRSLAIRTCSIGRTRRRRCSTPATCARSVRSAARRADTASRCSRRLRSIAPATSIRAARATGDSSSAPVAPTTSFRPIVVPLVMPLKPGRFVERLPFTTTPVRALTAVATDLGLFEPLVVDGARTLRLTSVMCERGKESETVAEIRRRSGFDIPAADRLVRHDPPQPQELARLRSFDPKRALLA